MGFYYVATYKRMFVNAKGNVQGAYIFACFFDLYSSIHCYLVLDLRVHLVTWTYTHIVWKYQTNYLFEYMIISIIFAEWCNNANISSKGFWIVMILKKSLAAK